MNIKQSTSTSASGKGGVPTRLVVFAFLAVVLFAIAGTFFLTREDPTFGVASLFKVRAQGDTDAQGATPPAGLASPTTSPSARALGENGAQDNLLDDVDGADEIPQTAQQAAVQQGGLDSRVAAMEQRLTRLDSQLDAAGGNATRAEGLLIAFAARRAIERGAPLGYLADQLRLRFGDAKPNAVQTVLNAGQYPITRDQLLARLEGLTAELEDAPDDESIFAMLGRELSQLFVVRHQDTASPAAERRLERARLFVESGRMRPAVAELRSLPNAIVAQEWIADAERFAAAQEALELLETAAVLERRELRDGAGDRVDQLSPTLSE